MSTAKFDTWQNTDGTENFKVRAWVNFNGTGVVAIRAAGNVSSITDNGTGDYTVNFASAMPDANYVAGGCGSLAGATDARRQSESSTPRTVSAFRVVTSNLSDAATDSTYVSLAFLR